MVTNDALRRTTTRVFDARAHTIYIAKILWVKKLCIGKMSVYGSYWVVIVVGYPIIGLELSAFNYIHRISLTLYPNPQPHTIGFGFSTSAWISKIIIHIQIIRIQIRSDAEIIHTTFIPIIWCDIWCDMPIVTNHLRHKKNWPVCSWVEPNTVPVGWRCSYSPKKILLSSFVAF
jgi:hypothetical protein